MTVQDIARFFPTPEDADAAFALFDKDMNGDATRDEVEIACMYVLPASPVAINTDQGVDVYRECHREQLSIEHSMRDLDSAVGRLDNILMTVYLFIVVLLLAVAFVRIKHHRIRTSPLIIISVGSTTAHLGHHDRNVHPQYVAPPPTPNCEELTPGGQV